MIWRWLWALCRRNSQDDAMEHPDDHDFEVRQTAQMRKASDDLYRRLAERDVEHRRELARMGAVQRDLDGIGRRRLDDGWHER